MFSLSRLDLERLGREQEKAIERRESNRAAIQQKERERSEREIALESARRELESVDSEASRIREEHSTLRAELATFEERQRAATVSLGRLDQQSREMTTRRQQVGAEIQRLGEHRSRLLSENIELDRSVTSIAEQTLELDSKAIQLAQEETGRRRELHEADESLKETRKKIEAAHAFRSEIEVALVRGQSELKFLDETSQKELGCNIDALGECDAEDPHEAERLYKELKLKIENLGPINPQALEEFDEAQQRHDFLTAQRQDLLDSIRDTEKSDQRNRYCLKIALPGSIQRYQ